MDFLGDVYEDTLDTGQSFWSWTVETIFDSFSPIPGRRKLFYPHATFDKLFVISNEARPFNCQSPPGN